MFAQQLLRWERGPVNSLQHLVFFVTLGKINTFLLLLTITIVLVSLYDPNMIPSPVPSYLFLLSAVTTIISGLQYVYRGLVWFQERAPSLPGVS